MTQYKAILESLQDLRVDAVNELYDVLIKEGFQEYTTVNNRVLVIFPDGRMLGMPKGAKKVHHNMIMQAADQTLATPGVQTVGNKGLGQYYNLLPVLSTGTNVMYIYKIITMDITPEQQERIDQFSKQWKVTILNVKGYDAI